MNVTVRIPEGETLRHSIHGYIAATWDIPISRLVGIVWGSEVMIWEGPE